MHISVFMDKMTIHFVINAFDVDTFYACTPHQKDTFLTKNVSYVVANSYRRSAKATGNSKKQTHYTRYDLSSLTFSEFALFIWYFPLHRTFHVGGYFPSIYEHSRISISSFSFMWMSTEDKASLHNLTFLREVCRFRSKQALKRSERHFCENSQGNYSASPRVRHRLKCQKVLL